MGGNALGVGMMIVCCVDSVKRRMFVESWATNISKVLRVVGVS